MVDFEAGIFVIVSGAAIVGALGCVFSARVAHSLLWLMFTFFAVAGAFLMASAEMLAAIQILVYLGSVMLVVQFGVMLTRRRIQDVESLPTLNAISAVSGVGVFERVRESIENTVDRTHEEILRKRVLERVLIELLHDARRIGAILNVVEDLDEFVSNPRRALLMA